MAASGGLDAKWVQFALFSVQVVALWRVYLEKARWKLTPF